MTSSNNLLAYRPRFADTHNSNLAPGVFINMEGVFPCLQSLSNYVPICQVFSDEEDGFRGGRALIGAGDGGNHFRVFSTTSDILTYGVAVQDCPEFNATCFQYASALILPAIYQEQRARDTEQCIYNDCYFMSLSRIV